MIKDKFWIYPAENGWIIDIYNSKNESKGLVLTHTLDEVGQALIDVSNGGNIIDQSFEEN